MASIKLLDNSLINKIAAGEVIERPASVVKELIENALDAKATMVNIEVREGGSKSIMVQDNGTGMSREDVLLCFRRHATSKIHHEKDLFHITSLGFRGEALASIAEVSNLQIRTKRELDKAGTFLEVEAGAVLKNESIGIPTGTIVQVADLFFNVPARKKYLKSNERELHHIIKVVTNYALLRHDVAFTLSHNDKELLNAPRTSSLLENITSLYGGEVGKNLIRVGYQEDGIKIEGYVSKPSLTRADKSEQSWYVNGRFVRNEIMTKAVYDAYHTLLFINRHPIFVLNVSIPPEEIDVNVHPAKTAIRLKNEQGIKQIIFSALKKAFITNSLVPEATLDQETQQAPIAQYAFTTHRQTTLDGDERVSSYAIPRPGIVRVEDKDQPKNVNFNKMVILGQVNRTYIVTEHALGMCIIDQHAAEERVNYEKFMNELKQKAIQTQKLVRPKVLELSPVQYQIAKNNKVFMKNFGFHFEEFGEHAIKLTTIPEIFGRLKSTLFIDILNEIARSKATLIDKEVEARIVRFACKASIKAGDELTQPQMIQLLRDLSKTSHPYSCPHGRPTVVNVSVADLEKKFKRTGW